MDSVMIDAHLKNIDRRLANLEQILPTLATKDALEPLATTEELGDLRQHMEVLTESLRGDIQLIAEHVASAMPKRTQP